jgi:hypothetical protein
MSNCSSGCQTKDHATWGECVRSKNTRVAWAASAKGMDLTTEKKWDKNLQDYRDARAQGVQPQGTQDHQIRAAMELSERTGTAYNAEKPIESLTGVSGLDPN